MYPSAIAYRLPRCRDDREAGRILPVHPVASRAWVRHDGEPVRERLRDRVADRPITLGHRDTSIPFSYYDDKQQVIGYAMDICMKIVDAVKAELKMPNLKVVLNPVTSATRIPLMANGTIDLECGSTTNNAGPTCFK